MPFSSSTDMSVPVHGVQGPIFVDGPHFDIAFRLFHGRNRVISFSSPSFMPVENPKPDSSQQFNPLAAKAASISLSCFGPGDLFGFDSFSQKWKKKNNKKFKCISNKSNLEIPANEWFQRGLCRVAKSYLAVSRVILLFSDMIEHPQGLTLQCPLTVIGAQASLDKKSSLKNPQLQSLVNILSTGLLCNVSSIAMLWNSVNMPKAAWL